VDREEALKLLKGRHAVIEWNRRREAGERIPKLTGADLGYAVLREANLRGADLRQARLHGAGLDAADLSAANLVAADLSIAQLSSANLSEADLRHADLDGAKLHAGDLKRANLSDANLSWAQLVAADLSGARLIGARLRRTALWGAKITGASCGGTTFAGVDLSEVMGLDSVEHVGPSTIGTDTLFLSKGKIPESFLRGCGVPESLIEYLPSVISSMQPIQFYSCFISHSSKDKTFADRLHSRMLQERLSVWYAPEAMRGGRKSIDQIDQAIRVYDKLLLVLTRASMTSEWVKYEIRRAIEREDRESRRVLFPIGLTSRKAIRAWSVFDADSGEDFAKRVREYHIPDFSNWKDHDSFEASFTRLLNDLKASEPASAKSE
jgi:hypothetical protein